MTESHVPAWPYFGNVRATNTMGASNVTYIDSHIASDGWGLLSTDDTSQPDSLEGYALNLTAIRCKLDFAKTYPGSALTGTPQGYGSYAIGSCHNTFVDCDFTVGGSALICANENAGGAFRGCKVDSDMFGIVWNGNQGGAVSLDNCRFQTRDATFIIRGCYANLQVENSTLESDTGVILTMIDSDDPGMGKGRFYFDTEVAVRDPEHDPFHENRHDVQLFGFERKAECTDMTASFQGCELNGDFYNSTTNAFQMKMPAMPPMEGAPEGMPPMPPMEGAPEGMPPMPPMDGAPEGIPPMPPMEGAAPAGGEMPAFMKDTKHYPTNLILRFTDCRINGRITASQSRHRVPYVDGSFEECGRVTSQAAPPVNNGVLVTLDASSWTVPDTCYLTALEISEDATVQAPAGKVLRMTVDGAETPITAGSYTGQIVLTVENA